MSDSGGTPRSRWKGLLAGLGTSLLTLVLLFGVGECAIRLFGPEPPPPVSAPVAGDSALGDEATASAAADGSAPSPSEAGPASEGGEAAAPTAGASDGKLPVLASVLEMGLPNVEGIHNGVYFRTNSQGMRGPEYAAEAAPGVFRIAVTGDSVTMGSGVDENDAYPKQLEALLNARGGERRYEVINVGLAGINTRVAVQRLRVATKAYDPQLFVYGFTINDIEGKRYHGNQAEQAEFVVFWRKAIGRYESPSRLWKWLWPRLVALALRVSPDLGDYETEIHHNFFENPEAWEDFEAALRRFARMAHVRGACGHVLIHTQITDLDENHPFLDIYAKVEQAAKKFGLTVTQTFEAYEGRAPRPLWVNAFDLHPNREGHAILAAELLKGLDALPQNCWNPKSPYGKPKEAGR